MSLPAPYSEVYEAGTGAQVEFPFGNNFKPISAGLVKCKVYFSDGYETVPTYTVDMTVGSITISALTAPDGTILTAPPIGSTVRIYRDEPEAQNVTASQLQAYTAKQLEIALDAIVAMIQEVSYMLDHKTVRLTEPQRDIALQQLSELEDGHLIYWDNTERKLVVTNYPQQDVVRCVNGLFFRLRTDPDTHNEFLQWSVDNSNWTSINVDAAQALAQSAYDLADDAYNLASNTRGELNAHKADHANPHETTLANLIDTDFSGVTAGQFIMYDGLHWTNVNSSATTSWGTILGNLDDQTDLKNALDAKVNLDGSSIMTGPLKFMAGSMRGAVAPYLNGVSFWKMDSQGNITNIANLTDSQFLPVTTNSIGLGNTTHTWKDAHVARVITSVLNNGYDIAVPVTNSADTLALKSQVDLAANSGSQLYTTGVWYAKMYSASTVPTGAEYDGRNYADFSQVDNDNNPIIVIYEGQSGAWVETDRITPPAEYNGYVTITSKIWDIAEQTDQQGGEVLWSYNQKTFTPYPKIVSLLNQANTDLSNLTDTGANIANWSSNVSNCITEIPQDIKLELNNGTLTLKAGSKYYYPNGAGVFESRTVPTDTTLTQGWGSSQTFLLFVRSDGSLGIYDTARCYSGTSSVSDGAYYNTNDNKVYVYYGGSLDYQASLPIAKITGQSPTITSIDQVFNGRGYIGSTVFVLPGVKGLIPNDRNTDGTLKSTAFTVSSVLTETTSSSGTNDLFLNASSISQVPTGTINYDSVDNYNKGSGFISSYAIVGKTITNTGVITSFEPKQAFHAVDYNDFATLETSKANTSLDNVSAGIDFVVESQLPTAQNNYTWYRKYKSGWVEQGRGLYIQSSATETISLPIEMSSAQYTLTALGSNTIKCQNLTRTTFQLVTTANTYLSWQVCGMAA